MSDHFVAEVHLLPTEAGGRKSPLVSGDWRTVLGINGEHWSARLYFTGDPLPGETFSAGVRLLSPSEALQFFNVGAEFTVWEGGTKGIGRVVSSAA